MRFECPDSRNRWDSPLFTIQVSSNTLKGKNTSLFTQGLEGYSWGLEFHQEMVQDSGFDCFQEVGFVKTGHGTQLDSDMKKSTGRIHPRIEPIFIEKENKHDS